MKFNESISVLRAADDSPLFRKVDMDASAVVELAKAKLKPQIDNAYVRVDEELRELAPVRAIERAVFAELPVEAGWCFGGGKRMNGMEWHRSSEVVVACTPCVLLLGSRDDVVRDVFDSSKCVALALDEGEVVELRAETLHLAPLAVEERFAAAIILPQGTNAPLAGGIDGALRAVNKWLLVHPENEKGIALGGKVGISGKNVTLLDEKHE